MTSEPECLCGVINHGRDTPVKQHPAHYLRNRLSMKPPLFVLLSEHRYKQHGVLLKKQINTSEKIRKKIVEWITNREWTASTLFIESKKRKNKKDMKILRFTPILKQTIWGGEKIAALKHIDTDMTRVGESWELSGVEGNETPTADGSMTLNQCVALYGSRLLGRANYERFGNTFPLLVKFIDARQDLSIQVHPDDVTARRLGRERGKTEMWYLMESAPEAALYSGLSRAITPSDYERMVADGTVCDALARYSAAEDDVFFLPAGRIHAIGAGCFLAEIQQTSDVTYRIYDYNRRDSNGNLRELHTREAVQSIDWHVEKDYRSHYEPCRNRVVNLVKCPYFCTSVYNIDRSVAIDHSAFDSFVILIGLKGTATVTTPEDEATLRAGETLLIAAENRDINVNGHAKLLEVHIG